MVCPADDASMSRGKLPTPTELIRHFDRFVLGQDRCKRDLAVAVYKHYLGARCGELPEAPATDFERQHILLLGPTGSGKTLLIRTLAEALGVPVTFAAATSFVETGYVGDHVESLIFNLVRAAKGDIELAQRGIVFIDEIDKIKREPGSCRDISGEGVQSALLTLLDGREITVRSTHQAATIDVSKVLFVCAGAFVGLDEITRDRLAATEPAAFGFGRGAGARGKPPAADMSVPDLLNRIETADLVKFGMIPEFIGRFSTVSALRPLDRADLVRILTDAQGALYTKQRALYALHGVELDFRPDALEAVADEAARLGTGARGLRRVMFRAMEQIDYRLPDLAAEGVTRITFTADSVRGGAAPILERGGEPERATQASVLRASALQPNTRRDRTRRERPLRDAAPMLTDTAGMSETQIRERLERTREQLGWSNTVGSARKWWLAFEQENKERLPLVLRLAEELLTRDATITEFFLAYVYSNTSNIQANLHFLDYTRLKKLQQQRDRDAAQQSGAAGEELEKEDEEDEDTLDDLDIQDHDCESDAPAQEDTPGENAESEDEPRGG